MKSVQRDAIIVITKSCELKALAEAVHSRVFSVPFVNGIAIDSSFLFSSVFSIHIMLAQ
jgi:hypothetical protein